MKVIRVLIICCGVVVLLYFLSESNCYLTKPLEIIQEEKGQILPPMITKLKHLIDISLKYLGVGVIIFSLFLWLGTSEKYLFLEKDGKYKTLPMLRILCGILLFGLSIFIWSFLG